MDGTDHKNCLLCDNERETRAFTPKWWGSGRYERLVVVGETLSESCSVGGKTEVQGQSRSHSCIDGERLAAAIHHAQLACGSSTQCRFHEVPFQTGLLTLSRSLAGRCHLNVCSKSHFPNARREQIKAKVQDKTGVRTPVCAQRESKPTRMLTCTPLCNLYAVLPGRRKASQTHQQPRIWYQANVILVFLPTPKRTPAPTYIPSCSMRLSAVEFVAVAG